MAASDARKRAVHDFKRVHLLQVAEALFSDHGLEGTSLRAIAKAAGYTAPAIYTYFATKEDLYGEIIARSLDDVLEHIELAVRDCATPAESFRAAILAYYSYYRDRPHQLDLGLYLFSGARPAGVTPEIDRELNRRFKKSVDRIADLHHALGGSTVELSKAVASGAIVHAIGIVIMAATKRLRLLQQDGDALMRQYVEQIEVDTRRTRSQAKQRSNEV